MFWLTLALAVLVGVTLGLFGGGGSILTVPLLVYVAGLDTKPAIATSLVVVGATAIGALVAHARAGRVQWRTGLTFGSTAMIGAYAGGRIGPSVPDLVLMVGFALMMLATSIAMIRGRRTPPAGDDRGEPTQAPVLLVLVEGVVVGLVTGVVGAGGGFLVVPALVLLGGLPMATAVGTSLLVISLKSFAALAGYLSAVQIDWGLAAAVTAMALLGSVLGSWLAGRIDPERLRKGFGIFVLAMAVFVLAQSGLAA